jgi:hypothetical protein
VEFDLELDFRNPSPSLDRLNPYGATVACDAAIGSFTLVIGHVTDAQLSVHLNPCRLAHMVVTLRVV